MSADCLERWVKTLAWLKYRWIDRQFGAGHPVSAEQWEDEYNNGSWEKMHDIAEIGRYAIIAAYIRKLRPDARILDVGCGEGILLSFLLGDTYSEYLGIDLSQTAIKKASSWQNSKTRFMVCDIHGYKAEGEYDVIILNEVLYYLSKPIGTMMRLTRSLGDKGIFVVSMMSPAGDRIWPRLERMLRAIGSQVITNDKGVTWKVGIFSGDHEQADLHRHATPHQL
jgi:2-polyprenyl-6-hydroxyphenyl methylase/3-demethylubiquinone-9 3-methyltransferase